MLCTVAPVSHLLLRAWGTPDPLAQVFSSRVGRLVTTTLVLAVTVTALASVVGVAMAWLLERTDLPARSWLRVAAVLPLVVPTYVGALALLAAVGPRGLAWEVPGMVGFWGLTLALVLSTYPYVLLTASGVLRSGDATLEEAARALGDTPWAAFRRVVVPQLRPALSAGGLLVFLYVLSDFGAVSIMRIDTLTRGIFLEYRGSFDRARPALLGLVLVVLTLAAIGAERRLRGRAAPARAGAGQRRPTMARLGGWRWPAVLAVAAVSFAGAGIPVAVLGYWSARAGDTGVGIALAGPGFTSVELSAVAAVVAVAASLPVAALYQTLPLLVAAYVVRFLPEALGAVRASLQQVDPALEEAARSLGRSGLEAARTITLPLVRGGMVAGAALVFLTAMKELPATLLLQPAGYETLATRVWVAASQGLYAQAAPAALALVAVSAGLLWPLLWRRSGRRPLATVPEVAAE